MAEGIIIKALSGSYFVADAQTNNIIPCKARGLFRYKEISPLVGDRVKFTVNDDETGTVSEILPRKNALVRPAVANIDMLFVVAAVADPAPNTFVLDKIIINAENNDIEPVLIINKSDLGDADELKQTYSNAGFKVFCVSATNDGQMDEIAKMMQGKTVAFTGNTGVGKSSIINVIAPTLALDTGEISRKLGRGRHTTRHIELYPCLGGYIADTPGFSSFDIERCGFIRKENLQFCFREFEPYITSCRFSGCSHTKEKGCAVINAVNEGIIAKSRFESYKRFYDESAAVHDWEIEE